MKPNAAPQPLPEAGATQERTLEAVGCRRLFGPDVPADYSENNTFSQKTLADSLQLPYPLLSDRTLSVIKAYGVLYGATEGKNEYPHMVGRIAKRSFFLIDQQGIVRGRWIGGDLDVFPSKMILQAAREMVGNP